MSVRTMITKLALAFAAKKGMEALSSAGGIEGLTRSLSGRGATPQADSGMQGRIGGTRSASAGGLGNILGSLGIGGATDAREGGVGGQISPLNQSLGHLFGNLAAAFGGATAAAGDRAGQSLDEQFDMQGIDDPSDARPIVMAMVQMARADGHIDEVEQRALLEFLDDASEDERRLLRDALNDPVDPARIAEQTPAHARREVYAAALLVGDPANEKEQQFLDDLRRALDLPDADAMRLRNTMYTDRSAA